MKHRQPGLFDVEERAAQLTHMGDPLVGLKARIDWEAFRPALKRVHEKDRKSRAGAKPLTEEQKLSNRMKSKIRARGEHVFGAQAAMDGHVVRTIGLQRARVKIGLMDLIYNMARLMHLIKRDANAVKWDLINARRKDAPIGA